MGDRITQKSTEMNPAELFESGAQALYESLNQSGVVNQKKYQAKKAEALARYDASLVAFAAHQLGCVCGFADWITFPDDSVRCSHCEKKRGEG